MKQESFCERSVIDGTVLVSDMTVHAINSSEKPAISAQLKSAPDFTYFHKNCSGFQILYVRVYMCVCIHVYVEMSC